MEKRVSNRLCRWLRTKEDQLIEYLREGREQPSGIFIDKIKKEEKSFSDMDSEG